MRRPPAVEGILQNQAIGRNDPQRRRRLEMNVRMRFSASHVVPRGDRTKEMIDTAVVQMMQRVLPIHRGADRDRHFHPRQFFQ